MKPHDQGRGDARSERARGHKHGEKGKSRGRAGLDREDIMLQKVIDGAKNVHIVCLDRDFNFIRVNEAYARTCGYRPAEMIGKNHFDLYPDEENEAIFRKVRETGESAEYHDKPFSFPDQPERGITYWDWTLEPIMDGKREVVSLVVSLVETTGRKRAEEALRESEERLRATVETASQAIWETNAEGEVVSDSPSWRAYTGQTMEECLGHGWMNAVHPEDRKLAERQWRDAVAAGQKVNIEFRLRSSDGGYRWTNLRAAPLRDARGRIVKWVGMNLDIEDRKRAEEALRLALRKAEEGDRMLKGLMDNVPEGITIADASFNLVAVSTHGQQLLGGPHANLSIAEVVSRWEVYRPDGTPMPFEELPLVRAMRSGELVKNAEIVQFNVRGESLPLLCNAAPLRDSNGAIVGGIAVWRDISDQKHSEEEIRRSNEELQQFAYVASHDLKEPLRMVTFYLDLVERKYDGKVLDSKAKEYMHFAADGAARMQQMVNDLLTYSRIEARGRLFQSVDMNDVLATVTNDLRKSIEESQASITCDPLPTLTADKTQMVQLLENLIGNAIKFRGGEAPRVQVSVRRNGSDWLFAVRDNGIGIDPGQKGRLFQMFSRLHTREEYEGTGIGLAIAKKIVERHGGHIWFESEPGKWTTFYFTIPVRGGQP